MNDRKIWRRYFITNYVRTYYNAAVLKLKLPKLVAKPKFTKPVLECDAANQQIRRFIEAGTPALVSRFGCVESKCIGEGIGIRNAQLKKFSRLTLQMIHNNAGVFPYGEDMAQRFCDIAVKSAKQVDLLGVWNTEMHDYLVNNVCPENVMITPLESLDPWNSNVPWTKALQDKRVLVIHPFEESIKKQYARRELLFESSDILPSFHLEVLKAIQTVGGNRDERFNDWEDALNYMYEQSLKTSFDVAIIGCGAYGMPLGAMLKDAGKTVIHLGGVTQILFGIKGKRWDENKTSELYNQYWIRPSESEVPNNACSVEDACYW